MFSRPSDSFIALLLCQEIGHNILYNPRLQCLCFCFSNIFLSLIWDCKWCFIYEYIFIQNLCSGLAFFLPRLYFRPLNSKKYSVLLKQISFSLHEDFRRIVSSQIYNEGSSQATLGKGRKRELCISVAKWNSAGHTSMLGSCSGAFFFSVRKFQNICYCGRVGYLNVPKIALSSDFEV